MTMFLIVSLAVILAALIAFVAVFQRMALGRSWQWADNDDAILAERQRADRVQERQRAAKRDVEARQQYEVDRAAEAKKRCEDDREHLAWINRQVKGHPRLYHLLKHIVPEPGKSKVSIPQLEGVVSKFYKTPEEFDEVRRIKMTRKLAEGAGYRFSFPVLPTPVRTESGQAFPMDGSEIENPPWLAPMSDEQREQSKRCKPWSSEPEDRRDQGMELAPGSNLPKQLDLAFPLDTKGKWWTTKPPQGGAASEPGRSAIPEMERCDDAPTVEDLWRLVSMDPPPNQH